MSSKLSLPLIFLLGVTSVWPARAQNAPKKGLATSTDTAAQTSADQAAPVAQQTSVGEFPTDAETVSTTEDAANATRNVSADMTAGAAEVVAVPDVAGEPAEVADELSEMMTLGWIETIQLGSDLGLEMKAKLDTGADSSSLDARNIRRVRVGDDLYVRFTIKHPETGRNIELRKPYLRRIRIKRHSGTFQRRYVVHMNVCIGGHSRGIDVNLVDRAYFDYPMLLGRSALRDLAIVDPNIVLTTEARCWDNSDRVINYDAVVDPDEVPVEDDIDGDNQSRKPRAADKDKKSVPDTNGTDTVTDAIAVETTQGSNPDNLDLANETVEPVETAPEIPGDSAEVVFESTDDDTYNVSHDETSSVLEAPQQPGETTIDESDPDEIAVTGDDVESDSVFFDESNQKVIDAVNAEGSAGALSAVDEIVEEQMDDSEGVHVGGNHDTSESVETVDSDLPAPALDINDTSKANLPGAAKVADDNPAAKSKRKSKTTHAPEPDEASESDAASESGAYDETDLTNGRATTTVEPEGAEPAQ